MKLETAKNTSGTKADETRIADLIIRINSIMTILNTNYEGAAAIFSAKLVECLVDHLQDEQIHQIIDSAAQHVQTVGKFQQVPIHKNGEIILLPVADIVSVVAHAEILHLTTVKNELFMINFRLKDFEVRIDSLKFVRLTRGSIVNLDFITSFKPTSSGAYLVTLTNGQQLKASRIQSRVLRELLLRL